MKPPSECLYFLKKLGSKVIAEGEKEEEKEEKEEEEEEEEEGGVK